MTSSLVGSEMCIRDRNKRVAWTGLGRARLRHSSRVLSGRRLMGRAGCKACLLYTSDAADDM
eukprot:3682886-Prorocentrum_lima.AAC.1